MPMPMQRWRSCAVTGPELGILRRRPKMFNSRENFASWEEYGRSFAFGRGVWHGDEEECQTAWEIVSELFENEASPWRQIPWNE